MLGPVVRKGDVVTGFELPDETGAPRRLSGLLADGPVVLFFYTSGASSNWLNAMSTSGRTMLGAWVTAAWAYVFPTPNARVDREKSTAPMHARRGEKRKTFMETTSEKSALSV